MDGTLSIISTEDGGNPPLTSQTATCYRAGQALGTAISKNCSLYIQATLGTDGQQTWAHCNYTTRGSGTALGCRTPNNGNGESRVEGVVANDCLFSPNPPPEASPPTAPPLGPLPASPPPVAPPPVHPQPQSACTAWIIGSSVAKGFGSKDDGEQCDDAGHVNDVSWTDRLSTLLLEGFNITTTHDFAASGNNATQVLDPDSSTNDDRTDMNKAFHQALSALRDSTPDNDYPADPNPDDVDQETPALLVIGLSLGNEGLRGTTNDEENDQVRDTFVVGLQNIVALVRAYGIAPLLGGVYTGAFNVGQALTTYEVRRMLGEQGVVPGVSISQGNYVDFLDGDSALHDCTSAAEAEADLNLTSPQDNLVGDGYVRCGDWRPEWMRMKPLNEDNKKSVLPYYDDDEIYYDHLHPNTFGYVAMYRAVSMSYLLSLAVEHGCTNVTQLVEYTQLGYAGTCIASSGGTALTTLATYVGDDDPAMSAFSARQDACSRLCDVTDGCIAISFMTQPELGHQDCRPDLATGIEPWRDLVNRTCILHGGDATTVVAANTDDSDAAYFGCFLGTPFPPAPPMPPPPPPQPPQTPVGYNTDDSADPHRPCRNDVPATGSDGTDYDRVSLSASECEAACSANPDCTGYEVRTSADTTYCELWKVFVQLHTGTYQDYQCHIKHAPPPPMPPAPVAPLEYIMSLGGCRNCVAVNADNTACVGSDPNDFTRVDNTNTVDECRYLCSIDDTCTAYEVQIVTPLGTCELWKVEVFPQAPTPVASNNYGCYMKDVVTPSSPPPPPPGPSPPPPSPSPPEGLICIDDCTHSYSYDLASDGDCDDGGPGSEYGNCDFGFDCADCGDRFGLPPSPPPTPPPTPPPPPPPSPPPPSPPSSSSILCDTSCDASTNDNGVYVEYEDNDGICDDGGPGSGFSHCTFGTDCSDCGDRVNPCTRYLASADADFEDDSNKNCFRLLDAYNDPTGVGRGTTCDDYMTNCLSGETTDYCLCEEHPSNGGCGWNGIRWPASSCDSLPLSWEETSSAASLSWSGTIDATIETLDLVTLTATVLTLVGTEDVNVTALPGSVVLLIQVFTTTNMLTSMVALLETTLGNTSAASATLGVSVLSVEPLRYSQGCRNDGSDDVCDDWGAAAWSGFAAEYCALLPPPCHPTPGCASPSVSFAIAQISICTIRLPTSTTFATGSGHARVPPPPRSPETAFARTGWRAPLDCPTGNISYSLPVRAVRPRP